MRTWPALEPGEAEITEPSDVLWRQLTRSLWDEEKNLPGTLACGPQASDLRKPSFSQKRIVSAQESRDWHQRNAASSSLGVWSLQVSDVIEATLRVVDDSNRNPAPGDEPQAPGHCYVDYRGVSKNEMRDARANLLRAMIGHGEAKTTDIGFQSRNAA